MEELSGILADLDLCVGCYACEVACKQENNVHIGTKWIKVISVGPEFFNGKPRADFFPMMTEECTLCEHRLSENLEPRCVDNCPTEALKLCNGNTELLAALQSGKRFQICKLKGQVPIFG